MFGVMPTASCLLRGIHPPPSISRSSFSGCSCKKTRVVGSEARREESVSASLPPLSSIRLTSVVTQMRTGENGIAKWEKGNL